MHMRACLYRAGACFLLPDDGLPYPRWTHVGVITVGNPAPVEQVSKRAKMKEKEASQRSRTKWRPMAMLVAPITQQQADEEETEKQEEQRKKKEHGKSKGPKPHYQWVGLPCKIEVEG